MGKLSAADGKDIFMLFKIKRIISLNLIYSIEALAFMTANKYHNVSAAVTSSDSSLLNQS